MFPLVAGCFPHQPTSVTSGLVRNPLRPRRVSSIAQTRRSWRGWLLKSNSPTREPPARPSDSSNPSKRKRKMSTFSRPALFGFTTLIIGGSLFYLLYRNDYVQPLPPTQSRSVIRANRLKREKHAADNREQFSELPFQKGNQLSTSADDKSAWTNFATKIEAFSSVTDIQWARVADKVTDFIMPEWAKNFPAAVRKLQRELSMAPGSLADEIWQEARDPDVNPEIRYSASVRVSSELCEEEKRFRARRKKVTSAALARYLGLPESEVHPDDVPCIAVVGSGGGLRALVAGTGSMLAASEDGLLDCVTYTAGVSGSCWLQALYHSSVGGQRFEKLVEHLKDRIGIHIAYPPEAFAALNSAPTNKFLLSGFVEKLKADPDADFGLVDIYGLILAARLLVPKGELGVDYRDLKLSNQRNNIRHGEHPMPIYTAVRHEIPILEKSSPEEKATDSPSESTKEKAKKEAWFQWFEFTPFELFCEEFSAGIPTWAVGRKFENGRHVAQDNSGYSVPEMRLPLLLGMWGSAFCATLSHYYKEIRPLVKGIAGFKGIDGMIEGRNEDLSKVHPIDPASIPNFVYGMDGMLPDSTPENIYKNTHIQLMDAGMSNNLPVYPLLRPGRDVDILIAFDASADIKTENWLSLMDGYAVQRGIKGWPIGAGWPRPKDTTQKTTQQLEEAEARTAAESDTKLQEAKAADKQQHDMKEAVGAEEEEPEDLGYCTVWVGTTQERPPTAASAPPRPKAVNEDWQLMEPDAGIAVIYFPFLANPQVPDVDPATSDYMSTWNFVYTPQDIDNVVQLARANFEEGREQTRMCVRAVYERKKKKRLQREAEEMQRLFRKHVRLEVEKIGKGDHFS
ncbi:acyl transferase/acyl hydrolase/lysophospholipase [Xylogone sp. PMI_703]|nr:acyl transferase/acyl hydrolase/lysophospholipase [Xylogone sp. PMI_703]